MDDIKARAQSSRVGWFSQDSFVWSDTQYDYSYWIDIRSDLKWLKLWPALTFQQTLASSCKKILKDSRDSLWYFCQNGEIYKDGVLVANTWVFSFNINAVEFTTNTIVIIYQTQLRRIDINTNVATLITLYSQYWAAYQDRPAVAYRNQLFFGNGKFLCSIDSTLLPLTFNPARLILDENTTIRFISTYLDQVKIYGFQWLNNEGNTIQYIRNGVDQVVNYRQVFREIKCRTWIDDAERDWIIWGTFSPQSTLACFSWPSYQYTYRNLNQSEKFELQWWFDGIGYKEWLLYIWWSTINAKWVFVIWQFLPSYPYSISHLYTLPFSEVWNVESIEFNSSNMYVWVWTNIYKWLVWWITTPWVWPYQTTGQIVSKKRYSDWISFIKQLEKIQIWADIPVGCFIKIEVSLDDWWRQEITTCTNATLERKRQRVMFNEFVDKQLNKQFSRAQTRITLSWNVSSTPTLYELIIFNKVIRN